MNFCATCLNFGARYLNFGARYLNFGAKISKPALLIGRGGGWVPQDLGALSIIGNIIFALPLGTNKGKAI